VLGKFTVFESGFDGYLILVPIRLKDWVADIPLTVIGSSSGPNVD
jgi:hypothetical protein